jgi:hypothetical protein
MIRSISQRLHHEGCTAQGMDQCLEQLFHVIIDNAYPSRIAAIWNERLLCNEMDSERYIYLVAWHTGSATIIKRWIADGKDAGQRSELLGSVYQFYP